MREDVSFMNVEKVVNPPQKPVVSNSFVLGDITFPVQVSPDRKPMTRHPNTLTESVPKGKDKAMSD